MKNHKRWITTLCALWAVLLLLSMPTLAAGNIDLSRGVELSVSYVAEDTPLSGGEFAVYRVAAREASGGLRVTEEFARYVDEIPDSGSEAWKTLAATLEGYVLRDKLEPADSGLTNRYGTVTFPSDGKTMTAGLYLVVGQRLVRNGVRYDATPFLALLPAQDENGDWDYKAVANAKYIASEIPENPEADTVSRKVLKVWNDDGHEQNRPKEVVMQLLRNRTVYDTVVLNADNNWRYTWENLSGEDTWLVVEKETENYTAEVAREDTTFVVTNTYHKPASGTNKPTTNNKPSSSLPQTGQLWWPVPALICVGLLFVVIGFTRRRGSGNETE